MAEGLSIREFARRDGCDDKVVRRKITSGHLPTLPDGTLDDALVGTDWRRRTFKPADTGDENEDVRTFDEDETAEEIADRLVTESGAPWTKAEAERVKENYLARLKQIDYDKRNGLVVEIEDVFKAVVGEYSLVRNKLTGIGSKLAHEVVLLQSAEEVKALIDKEVAKALEELTLDGATLNSDSERTEALQRRFEAST